METEYSLSENDGSESEWEYEYEPNETEVCPYDIHPLLFENRAH